MPTPETAGPALEQAKRSSAAPSVSLGGGVDASAQTPKLETVGRAKPPPHETPRQDAPIAESIPLQKRGPVNRRLLGLARGLATLAIALVAILMALLTWNYYVTAPWTRDGRVRVQVASVAPQVSGQITELRVGDNQYVHKGDVLYLIDTFDFEAALLGNKAQLQQKAADLQVKQMQSLRRQQLSSLATTPEEQQTFAGAAVQAKAAFEAAHQQVAQAEINLQRTKVLSPVNGYVTNLLMRVGDYAHVGGADISIIDTDSYWIDGYFEETKMARICIGDRVEAKLLGYSQPILGHVASVTRGIGVSDAAAGTQGLPNVDPVYTWVRLAQRVPVRIAIDSVPPGVPLVSGMTATVTVKDADGANPDTWLDRTIAAIKGRLSDVFEGPPTRPDCIPATTTERAMPMSLSVDEEGSAPAPDQLNPGLAPSVAGSPRNQ
jgi:multidrug resistance efflux pump